MSKNKYAKLRVEQLEDRHCPSPLTLPAALTFNGVQWPIANNTDAIPGAGTGLGITDATQTAGAGGHSDAYDGAFLVAVNGVRFILRGNGNGRTHVTMLEWPKSGVVARLLGPLFAPALQLRNAETLRRLRNLSESS